MALALLAGLALGGLVGLLVGLSASPVVAQVMGLLTTIAMAFLGLRPDSAADAERPGAPPAAARLLMLAAFCLACAGATLGGLYLRTHDSLSPSPADLRRQLVDLGVEKDDATRLVVSRLLEPPQPGTASAAWRSSVLYAADSDDDATEGLGPSHRPEDYERAGLEALWRRRGHPWRAFVTALADLDLSDDAFLAACGRFHRAQFDPEVTP